MAVGWRWVWDNNAGEVAWGAPYVQGHAEAVRQPPRRPAGGGGAVEPLLEVAAGHELRDEEAAVAVGEAGPEERQHVRVRHGREALDLA